jgi:hypothetical protein
VAFSSLRSQVPNCKWFSKAALVCYTSLPSLINHRTWALIVVIVVTWAFSTLWFAEIDLRDVDTSFASHVMVRCLCGPAMVAPRVVLSQIFIGDHGIIVLECAQHMLGDPDHNWSILTAVFHYVHKVCVSIAFSTFLATTLMCQEIPRFVNQSDCDYLYFWGRNFIAQSFVISTDDWSSHLRTSNLDSSCVMLRSWCPFHNLTSCVSFWQVYQRSTSSSSVMAMVYRYWRHLQYRPAHCRGLHTVDTRYCVYGHKYYWNICLLLHSVQMCCSGQLQCSISTHEPENRGYSYNYFADSYKSRWVTTVLVYRFTL